MTLFWVIAALLVGLALAFLVTPLCVTAPRQRQCDSCRSQLATFREQLVELDADLAAGSIDREQWEVARGDLQRGLLEAVDAPRPRNVVSVPGSGSCSRGCGAAHSVSLYLGLGNPQALAPGKVNTAQGRPTTHAGADQPHGCAFGAEAGV
jgi:cytochrome c-type biogenesis protein CcmI